MQEKNEKILITGKPSFKKLPILCIITGIVLLLITIITGWSWDDFALVMYFVSPAIIFAGFILYLYAGMCSITVTDKRVYGKAGFGTRVDLPFDMISAVGTTMMWNGIVVSTSSGMIKFMYINNSSEIHSIISETLLNRQDKNQNGIQITKQELSSADELKKFKDLLDIGAISQEEYDQKKKELLGL